MAKIDVLLPVKNGIDYLAESLDSIRNQSFRDWRLLVLDHGSTDGSREMAERYHESDARIEVRSFPDAVGLAGLLNRGLDSCDCDYVMRHDADDICLPERMQLVLDGFAAQPGCVALGGQADVINGAGQPVGEMTMPVGKNRVSAASLFCNPMAHPTVMLDFAALNRLGVRYGADFLNVLPAQHSIAVHALAEDYFMFGQLALLGKCNNLPSRLIHYRRHGSNVSATRFVEQMEVSLSISRFLARSFSVMHGLPYVDPAPFCNHGGVLFDVDGGADFDTEFERIARMLRQVWGDSDDLDRELDFRRATAKRGDMQMLWRYGQFRSRNAPEAGEWNAIRSWLLRRFPSKRSMRVASEQMAWPAQ